MGRKMRAELVYADIECGRFVRAEMAEFERIGLPKVSAFAKMAGRGSVPPVTPDDPVMVLVGRWFAMLEPMQKAVLVSRYTSRDQQYLRDHDIVWTTSRTYQEWQRLLSELNGVLKIGGHFFSENNPYIVSV